MILNMYSIYDAAVQAYCRPVSSEADGKAVREFGDLCRNKETPYGAHPEDYSLVRLGRFDDKTGVFHPEDPNVIAKGWELSPSSQLAPGDSNGSGRPVPATELAPANYGGTD